MTISFAIISSMLIFSKAFLKSVSIEFNWHSFYNAQIVQLWFTTKFRLIYISCTHDIVLLWWFYIPRLKIYRLLSLMILGSPIEYMHFNPTWHMCHQLKSIKSKVRSQKFFPTLSCTTDNIILSVVVLLSDWYGNVLMKFFQVVGKIQSVT